MLRALHGHPAPRVQHCALTPGERRPRHRLLKASTHLMEQGSAGKRRHQWALPVVPSEIPPTFRDNLSHLPVPQGKSLSGTGNTGIRNWFCSFQLIANSLPNGHRHWDRDGTVPRRENRERHLGERCQQGGAPRPRARAREDLQFGRKQKTVSNSLPSDGGPETGWSACRRGPAARSGPVRPPLATGL